MNSEYLLPMLGFALLINALILYVVIKAAIKDAGRKYQRTMVKIAALAIRNEANEAELKQILNESDLGFHWMEDHFTPHKKSY